MHFHGQKTSRQNRYKSIFEDSCHKRTMVFRLLSLVLFFTPDVHLRELKKVWTDEVIIEEIWRSFMQKLVSEWAELVLYVSCAFFLSWKGTTSQPPSQLSCLLQMSHLLLSQALSHQGIQREGSKHLLLKLQVPYHWCSVSGVSLPAFCSSAAIVQWGRRTL